MHRFVRTMTLVLLALGAACLASCRGVTDWCQGRFQFSGFSRFDFAGSRHLLE